MKFGLYIDFELRKSVATLNKTRRWHVTISCQPDGRPPQPVRPWKSGRVHLAEGSNVVVLEKKYVLSNSQSVQCNFFIF